MYPDTCLFGDILSLIKNTIDKDKVLDPKDIRFKSKAGHDRLCPLRIKGSSLVGSTMHLVLPVTFLQQKYP